MRNHYVIKVIDAYYCGLSLLGVEDCDVGDEVWDQRQSVALRFNTRERAEKLIQAWWPNDRDVRVVKLKREF